MTIGDLANYLNAINDQGGTVYLQLPDSGPDDDYATIEVSDLTIDTDGDLIVVVRP